jgi:hypothetical protein
VTSTAAPRGGRRPAIAASVVISRSQEYRNTAVSQLCTCRAVRLYSKESPLGASAAAAYQPRQRMQESQEDEVVVFAKPPPPDLKCSICLELFRDPLITNCGHTFCSRCVYQVSGGASGDQCAVCRKSVVVTELSPNLLAKSLVDEQLVGLQPYICCVIVRSTC